MLETIKQQVLSLVAAKGYWADVVDRNWDDFAVQALNLPLLWLFYTRLLATTDWPKYGCGRRALAVLYILAMLIVLELARILAAKLLSGQMSCRELGSQTLMMAKRAKSALDNNEQVTEMKNAISETFSGLKRRMWASGEDRDSM